MAACFDVWLRAPAPAAVWHGLLLDVPRFTIRAEREPRPRMTGRNPGQESRQRLDVVSQQGTPRFMNIYCGKFARSLVRGARSDWPVCVYGLNA